MTREPQSIVDQIYLELKRQVMVFELKPGARLNEVEIARSLGASRTPLREALNRLTAEGFLTFIPGKGFFCRILDAEEIFDLYEFRKSLEVSAVRLAIQRAKDEEIKELDEFLDQTSEEEGYTVFQLVEFDEMFHERLMAMSRNREMLRVLRNINDRIKFVRWIDMKRGSRTKTQAEHRSIVKALAARDEVACVAVLENHIVRRLDQMTSAIREGFAEIYMGKEQVALAAR